MRKAGRKPGEDSREAQEDQLSKPVWPGVWRPGERSQIRLSRALGNLDSGLWAEQVGWKAETVRV